ncbi:tetratricopeptide repeat protein [Rubrobacter taiwanensis]|uniref:Tetratricopeptide repeat protein n=1 Tax=Rubrobacter taiwanensis TaxID=185139 RepID=A0A4R1BSC8_9ACTN|nr:tetratricopeptide repeat protein [Rubrobacter taiwanensis]TCJ20680.1 tetratricopeptide repeat protein [Rubrobacter taiwanensis]
MHGKIKPTGRARRAERPGEPGRSRLRSPEAGLLAAALISLAVLLPLRGVFSGLPPAMFLATLTLFMFPGALASLLLLGRRLPLPAHVPVALVLSVGLFGLLGLPALVLHWNPGTYLALCAGVLASSLALAAFRVLEGRSGPPGGRLFTPDWLWVPFLAVAGLLAHLSAVRVRHANEDIWVYLAYVREFLTTDRLGFYYPYTGAEAEFSRLSINGWLLEISTLAWVSGIDPVDLMLTYLSPAMIVAALLAVYALARTILGSETGALLAGTLTGLFFLIYLKSSLFTPGGEFIARIAEDKYVARFLFLPVALALGILFLRERTLLMLALFTFVCWSVVAVHPMGIMFIGIAVGGFALVHLVTNPREWAPTVHLGTAVLSIGFPPAFYLLMTGNPLMRRLDTANPAVREQLLETWQRQDRLIETGAGTYIADPSLFTNPVILAAYAVGVPFLLWRSEGAAKWLLGTMLLSPALIYVPPVATLIGDRIGPWLLFRLAWPAYLAALVTLGWVCYELLRFARSRAERHRGLRELSPFVPLIFATVAAAAAAPSAAAGIGTLDRPENLAQDQTSCADPAFRWMQGVIDTPSLVLAPEAESGCLAAYSGEANVVSFRSRLDDDGLQDAREQVPANARFVREFYGSGVMDERALRFMQNQKVRYVLLPVNSELGTQLEHLPGFTKLEAPGDRYRLYEVNPGELQATPAVRGNTLLRAGETERAVELYNRALAGGEDERFLALVGLGRAHLQNNDFARAATSFEQALEISEDPDVRSLLSQAYLNQADLRRAAAELERAVELEPRRVKHRLQLASILIFIRETGAAIEQHRAVLGLYPEVPLYRVALGSALNQAGQYAAADAEFERALSQNPLSAELYTRVAEAQRHAGRPEEAREAYERALELNPEYGPARKGLEGLERS